MSDWENYDFAVTHVKRDGDGDIALLKGRVVEGETVRDLPIELTVPKAVEYLGYDGRFCTARERDGELVIGSEIEVLDEGENPSLRTAEGSPEEEQLTNLPEVNEE